MRFRNLCRTRSYCPYTRTSFNPGMCSADTPKLAEVLKEILKYTTSFEPLLTKEEEGLIKKLTDLSAKAKARDPKTLPGYNDPTGQKFLVEQRKAAAIAESKKREILAKMIKEHDDSRKDLVVEDAKVAIEAKRVEGTPTSLADIMGHNEAIRRGME